MALDIALLGDDGSVQEEMAVSDRHHIKLLKVAAAQSMRLLPRLHDYYADVVFVVEELPVLRGELAEIAKLVQDDPDLVDLIMRFQQLIIKAHRRGSGISAIAD